MTSRCLLLLLTLAVASAADDNCGVNLLYQTDNSLIQSHKLYGRKAYDPNSHCRYMIRAWTPEYRIEVSSVSFDLEYTDGCGADALTVYAGGNESSPVIGQFCGSSSWSVLSPGSSVFLIFSSDRYLQKGGFELRYRFVPSSEFETRATCPNNFLSCSNGRGCYPKKWKCDGIKDCRDGSDEAFCDSTALKCPSGQKPCKDNSKCVFNKWWCDGFKDCKDGSDESNCPGGSGGNDGSGSGSGGSGSGSGGSGSGTGGGPSGGNCGNPAISPDESRIVGGKPAIPHSWPWMVSLRLYGGHFCGGSIYNEYWIITAAHCVQSYMNPSLWKVDAGRFCRSCNEGSLQRRSVVKIVKHPSYNPSRTDQDMAMMKLSSPLTFNDKVSPVCLPSSVASVNADCFATGWGATQGTGDNNKLLQVMVPIVSNSKCSSSGYYGGAITQYMLCAGYDQGGKDACQGDSGGPLVCKSSGQWQLQGVTSWGEGCAKPQRPGVYARVSKYVSWIQQSVANN